MLDPKSSNIIPRVYSGVLFGRLYAPIGRSKRCGAMQPRRCGHGDAVNRKSMRNRCLEGTRGSQNRPKIDPGTLSGHSGAPGDDPECPGRAPRASRARPGSTRTAPEVGQGRPGTPKRAAKSIRERAEATKIDTESRPGAKKSGFCRSTQSRSLDGSMFPRILSIFGVFAKSAKAVSCGQGHTKQGLAVVEISRPA